MLNPLVLKFDSSVWDLKPCVFVPTLQLFITNRCNTRCAECFMKKRIGCGDMSLDTYKAHVQKYLPQIKKIILMGGEPTLHKDIIPMLEYNKELGLRTTIYTNGFCLDRIDGYSDYATIRVGVVGIENCEKPLNRVRIPKGFKAECTLMLRQNNKHLIYDVAAKSEELGFTKYFMSSMVDIHESAGYWDTAESCLSHDAYFDVVQDFVHKYSGGMKEIQVSIRGRMAAPGGEHNTCRFLNIFPNGEQVVCPFDIAKNIKHEGTLSFVRESAIKIINVYYKSIFSLERLTFKFKEIDMETIKHDHGKLDWSLLPSESIEEVLKVMAFGAAKYEKNNWRSGTTHMRALSACFRHCIAYMRGEDNDPESGICHLAHACTNLLFILYYRKYSKGVDDRFIEGFSDKNSATSST